jgi:16S rRNA processing protein RimM
MMAKLPKSDTALKRIGTITGCHGVKGMLKVRPSSHEPDWLDALEEIVLRLKGKPDKTVTLTHAQFTGKQVLMRFAECPDRNAAELWVGAQLFAPVSDLPQPEDDEFWVDDLIGLKAEQQLNDGSRLSIGAVHDVLSQGDQDFVEIKLSAETGKPGETIIIPFNKHFCPDINMASGVLVLHHLDGFLDPPSPQDVPEHEQGD